MRKKKRGRRELPQRMFFAAGFLLCATAVFYPLISNCLYEHMQSGVISEYKESVSRMGKSEVDGEQKACIAYNEALKVYQKTKVSTEDVSLNEWTAYDERLAGTDGIMGYIEIPDIDVYLPVYHGVSDDVLAKGLGHVPETSLPVGGTGTHAVITGHTGVSGKRLFTDLPDLQVGDVFAVHVLGETLYYEIDQIETVLPYETEELLAKDGMDCITLVTCTPFGINSHRLLVRGVRTEVPEEEDSHESHAGNDKAGISTWMKHYIAAVMTAAAASWAAIILISYILRWKNKQIVNVQKGD